MIERFKPAEDRTGQVWEVWDGVHFRDRPESERHWLTVLIVSPPRREIDGEKVRVLILNVTNPSNEDHVAGRSQDWYAAWFEGHPQARRIA